MTNREIGDPGETNRGHSAMFYGLSGICIPHRAACDAELRIVVFVFSNSYACQELELKMRNPRRFSWQKAASPYIYVCTVLPRGNLLSQSGGQTFLEEPFRNQEDRHSCLSGELDKIRRNATDRNVCPPDIDGDFINHDLCERLHYIRGGERLRRKEWRQ